MIRNSTLSSEFEYSNVKMAIYWRSLGELDVYSTGKICTVTGLNVDHVIQMLKSHSIIVEYID